MYKHLTLEQRYQIQAFLAAGKSVAFIAKQLGVHRSTIYRELRRNSTHSATPPDKYKAANAQTFAEHRAYKPSKTKSICPAIIRRIVWLLRRGWSPQQISEVCKAKGVAMLSAEAIYLWLYEQKRNKTPYQYLLSLLRRGHRRRRKRRLSKQPREIIKDRVSITERPEAVNNKSRSGDLETDLVKCQGGYLLTITDRKSLYNVITKLPNKEAETITAAIIKALLPYKGQIFTITSDNGTEFVKHQKVAEALAIDWYFADPYRSQQRGCNENQNGLIRQYFTRKTDLSKVEDADVQKVQDILNSRPRKKLGYLPPKKLFLRSPDVALVA